MRLERNRASRTGFLRSYRGFGRCAGILWRKQAFSIVGFACNKLKVVHVREAGEFKSTVDWLVTSSHLTRGTSPIFCQSLTGHLPYEIQIA